MHRRWRVRHSYPKPVVELVSLLLPLRAVREISALLDIPMSVIYRWRALQDVNAVASECCLADAQTIASAVARCNELGFRFAERPALPRHVPAQPLPQVSTPALEASGQMPDAAGRVDGGREPASAARGAEEPRCTRCATEQHYTFDARKERSTRRVRQRLEAARRVIDEEYYLEIDCRMLADTARMSRHHFIRVFSQLFGSTPHQYLIHTRVQAAKRLLLASREPIEVIAAGVGFRSGQSLNRAFKQTEGMSVSRFCSVIGNHAPIARAATPLHAPARDRAHALASGAMTSVASRTHASSSTC